MRGELQYGETLEVVIREKESYPLEDERRLKTL